MISLYATLLPPPVSKASASRGFQLISAGGTPTNIGARARFVEYRASESASSNTRRASRSVRTGKGSVPKSSKSIVPPTVVARCSVVNRRIFVMPDRPCVSAAQLSSLPRPSEDTTPMPVTQTAERCLEVQIISSQPMLREFAGALRI